MPHKVNSREGSTKRKKGDCSSSVAPDSEMRKSLQCTGVDERRQTTLGVANQQIVKESWDAQPEKSS